ncbi:MAG: restriction endonuclease subunit S [Anaerolineae bacterium]|nr:restriction endonuclease subunit S [Anaerolineae bacterium]
MKKSASWKVEKLGNLCEKITDGTHVTPTYVSEGVPFLSVKNLTKGFIDFSDTRYISREEHEILTKRVRPEREDILYTKVGTTGIAKVVDVDEEFSIFVSVALLKIKHDLIFNRYLEHFLNSPIAREQAQKRTRGMANKNLVINDIKEIEIHYPESLPEQQRIVSLLDETFAGLAQVHANAERNLVNAREVFEAAVEEIFSSLQDGLQELTIGEVCAEIFAGGDAPKDNYSEKRTEKYNIPIFANAVKDNGLYGFTDIARVTEPSITISARGSGTGHTEIRNESYLPIVRLIVLIPKLSIITLEFLKYSIGNLEILRSGSAIPQLTVPMIKEYKIPVPPLEEQRAIVQRLDALAAETSRLEAVYQSKLEAVEELRKSVLGKAFEGELSIDN